VIRSLSIVFIVVNKC